MTFKKMEKRKIARKHIETNKKEDGRLLLYIIIGICLIINISLSIYYVNTKQDINLIYDKLNDPNKNYGSQIRKIRWCGDDAILIQGTGMSMFPYTWEDGWHWAEPVEYSDIDIGDVITYKINNTLTRHAVINLYADRLYTMGYNNNNIQDPYEVLPEHIISRDCMQGDNPKQLNKENGMVR
jgi:hypothetical protein